MSEPSGGQILSEPESPRGKMLMYNPAEMLQAQAAGEWDIMLRLEHANRPLENA